MELGLTYTEKFIIDSSLIERFADLSKDYNPIHIDPNVAKEYGYPRQVAHGVIQLACLSKIIGMNLPGEGAIWMSQNINWIAPVLLGDEITFKVNVTQYSESAKQVNIQVEVFNQNNNIVTKGNGTVKIAKTLSLDHKIVDDTSTDINSNEESRKNQNQRDLPANKVALVTGASRGIGAQVAIDLAKNGFYVVVNYLSDKFSADKVVEEIQSSGGVCIAIKADIKRENDVIALVEEVNDKFGSCDIVVHGATPSIYSKYVNEITYDDVDRYLQVYLGGSINLVKHISPRMKEKNFGRFIFLGTSYLFETPPDGYSSYIIAKEALWGYVRTLSASLGKYGITTNMVSPSLTITDLTRDVPVRVKEIEAIKSPIRRLISTNDIPHRITSLCSKESGYENGKNIPITGGMV